MELQLQDTVRLKKPHPCGNDMFLVTRVGMDIKLRCTRCGHEVMLPRKKAEKAIKQILPKEND